MIHAVSANKPSFRSVTFDKGLNVILADKTTESDERDSRNGLGKSSLIEIIHFCLGSDFKRGQGLGKDALNGWAFTLDLDVATKRVKATRHTQNQGYVVIDGDTTGWPIQPSYDEEVGQKVLPINDWTLLLGKAMFDLPIVHGKTKYHPSFRQLISYFVRRGRDAYTKPFEFFRNQKPWQTQVANTYLLGLSWEHARDWQTLKDKEDELTRLKRAAKAGVIDNLIGTVGELEAVKLRLEAKVSEEQRQLDSFQVHPKYKEIEQEANQFTEEIHELSNENISSSKMVEYYEESLKQEKVNSPDEIKQVYAQTGVVFGEKITKRLDEVLTFHETLVKNREEFLRTEITKLKRATDSRRKKIEELSNERAKRIVLLRSHKALDEYTRLQQLHLETVSRLEEVRRKIEMLKKFEEGKSALRIELEELKQNARRDYDERHSARQRAISIFNANSEALYNRPGQLIIDITDSGFSFKIEIERAESDGIQLMEVFCYDLMLGQLWSAQKSNPGFLIHDSTVYADVDERQIAHAIELSAKKSSEAHFQYICCLNSDKVPWTLFDKDFDLKKYVRLELKDDPETACLFGFRF